MTTFLHTLAQRGNSWMDEVGGGGSWWTGAIVAAIILFLAYKQGDFGRKK